MILESLVRYYEALQREGKLAGAGWCTAKVTFALELSLDGGLLRVISLKKPQERGKKTVLVPRPFLVPQMVTRSSGVLANFLCDNSSYLLGNDQKGKPARSLECFEAARVKHLEVLDGADGPAALAVRRYFETWRPERAAEHPAFADVWDEITAGGNLIFLFSGNYVHEDPDVRKAWEKYCGEGESGPRGICLVTGRRTEIARIHGTIKGLPGAQSSGAALVSFNAPAFESYGKEQSYNAPVGVYAADAYTAALNFLVSDRDHSVLLGDTTVVYWSEDGEETYRNVFAAVSEPTVDNQEIVNGVFRNLEAGKAVDVPGVSKSLSPDQKFYILGLAPNAARIAVRFFYQDSFGNILKHIREHYERLRIVKPAADSMEYLGIWRLLYETVNRKSKDKKPVPGMAAAVYRAILSGGRYPDGLYQGVLGRIRAEQDDKDAYIYKITRGRAAIVKAFLLRNASGEKEGIMVGLNEESNNVAYTLGRIFAVLEAVQEEANRGINATIKDRYFNSACATPAAIFPILFKLKNSHIRKIEDVGKKVFYEKQLGKLQDHFYVEDDSRPAYPKRLTLEEQGMFILGYYQQTQKRYEKRVKEEWKDGGTDQEPV